jgi:hypothetical protein
MAKRNWFDSIEDVVPSAKFEFNLPAFKNGMNLAKTLFGEPFDLDNVNEHITPFDDFMAALDGFGFKDKGDHYEMVTGLGGHEAAEDAVKVELTGKNNRTVEITYEHSTSTDENNFYSHSQKTSATLPADADEETIKAYFDEKGNVVVSVKKKAKEPVKKGPRQIPVGVRHKDE